MTELVSLPDIKQHLRLDGSDTPEDDYLTALLTAAVGLVELFLDRPVAGEGATLGAQDLVVVGQAIRLIVGIWYRDREGEGELPSMIGTMLRPLRKFDDGSE